MLIKDYTLGKKDIKFATYAQQFINNLQQATHLSFNEQQEIINQFEKNLFVAKEIHFGPNIKSNFYGYHLFELINAMQETRLINLRNRKICFINHELGEHFLIDEKEMNDKETINSYYLLAKEIFNKKKREEKITFIKENIENLPFSPISDNYKNLSIKEIDKIYIDICCVLSPQFKQNLKKNVSLSNIVRNIETSKKKARLKAIHNFYQENRLSFLTLTLPKHNANGSLSQEVLNLDKIEPLSKLFMKKLRQEMRIYLKQKLNYSLSKIKYFMKKTFKSLKVTQIQQSKVIHFHFLFNVNLLKMFGYDNKVMFQRKGILFNTEFYQNPEYYQKNQAKYNLKNGWFFQQKPHLIVPKVTKWWADIVTNNLPSLKKLNPRSQNLQIFTKGENNITLKQEINECFLKQITVKNNFADIVSNYVTKYASGLTINEMSKMIVKNNRLFIGKRLFQFSLSCQSCPIEKTIKYLPFDLSQQSKALTAFYFQDILNFKKEHIFTHLLKNHMMRVNGYQRIKNDQGLTFFHQNQTLFSQKYRQFLGKTATFYFTAYYSATPFDSLKARKKYLLMLESLNHIFNLSQLKKHQPLENNHDKIKYYTQFHNYIDPLSQTLVC
ncbi:hypothetical protein C6B37_02335 [Candidatus Phytoplasma phoenicium]|uniref:Uncharacterized protein n=1 Tax=Candidatus Phytoplasma phoenicium TaxID=198422 RepID=A0A2S8NTB3_9MOLU|nr:hypothetical protein C6B37_02335 [Candidatus Phytoplasma phoenicium]